MEERKNKKKSKENGIGIRRKRIIPPCKKCPYKRGLVKMVLNPCPECKLHNYRTYDLLIKIMMGDGMT